GNFMMRLPQGNFMMCLPQCKLGIVKFIEAEQVPEVETVIHLVVASSDTRHGVATAADLELKSKQSIIDWNNPLIVNKMYKVYLGDIPLKTKGASLKRELKHEPVVYDGLFGANTNNKLLSLTLQFVHHICQVCPDTNKPLGLMLLNGLTKLINEYKEDPKLMCMAYSAEEPDVRLAIQEALSMMVGAYANLQGALLNLMEALPEVQVRQVAMKYASTVFAPDHVPSRYLLLLAAGDPRETQCPDLIERDPECPDLIVSLWRETQCPDLIVSLWCVIIGERPRERDPECPDLIVSLWRETQCPDLIVSLWRETQCPDLIERDPSVPDLIVSLWCVIIGERTQCPDLIVSLWRETQCPDLIVSLWCVIIGERPRERDPECPDLIVSVWRETQCPDLIVSVWRETQCPDLIVSLWRETQCPDLIVSLWRETQCPDLIERDPECPDLIVSLWRETQCPDLIVSLWCVIIGERPQSVPDLIVSLWRETQCPDLIVSLWCVIIGERPVPDLIVSCRRETQCPDLIVSLRREEVCSEAQRVLRALPAKKSEKVGCKPMPSFPDMVAYIQEKAAQRMKTPAKYVVGTYTLPFNPSAFGESLADMQDDAPAIGRYVHTLLSNEPLTPPSSAGTKGPEVNPVQVYIHLLQQLLSAVGGVPVMYCLLEVVSVCPHNLAPRFIDKIDWIKSLMNTNKEDLRELAAQLYAVVVSTMSGNELKTAVQTLIKITKDTHSPETQHGAIMALGYMVGRYMSKRKSFTNGDSALNREQRMSATPKEDEELVAIATKAIGSFLDSGSPLLAVAACTALGEMGRNGPLLIPSEGEGFTKLAMVDNMLARIPSGKETLKMKERAIQTLGYLPVGDGDFAHQKKLLQGLMDSVESNDVVLWVLNSILAKYIPSQNPHVRQAACIWLLSLVKKLHQHKEIRVTAQLNGVRGQGLGWWSELQPSTKEAGYGTLGLE
ncbi:unnamed protein product, partial [Coregonus sp. 'balchen']